MTCLKARIFSVTAVRTSNYYFGSNTSMANINTRLLITVCRRLVTSLNQEEQFTLYIVGTPIINSSAVIPPSVLRQVHSLFRSLFAIQCDLVLPLSISSTLAFPQGCPATAYAFFFVFPSPLSFPLSVLQQRVLGGSSYARCDQSS